MGVLLNRFLTAQSHHTLNPQNSFPVVLQVQGQKIFFFFSEEAEKERLITTGVCALTWLAHLSLEPQTPESGGL